MTTGTNVYAGGTARMSDGWISGLTYTHLVSALALPTFRTVFALAVHDADANTRGRAAWRSASMHRLMAAWPGGGLFGSACRFQGTGSVKGNQYTRGKNNPGGGCNYRHWTVASGQCVCQSNNINMASQGCGRAHGSHRGLGDWPIGGGGLHTGHVGEWWYFKKARAHGGFRSGYCHGRGYTACDVMLYVR